MIVYDPRDNKYKESDNPALLAGQALEYILEASSISLSEDFYITIINFANYCDSIIEISKN